MLGSLFEPAGSHPWLVDWLWSLYEAVLQPFLCLAGPASDGTAVTRFREYWQSLPWQKATFHCISPGQALLLLLLLLLMVMMRLHESEVAVHLLSLFS